MANGASLGGIDGDDGDEGRHAAPTADRERRRAGHDVIADLGKHGFTPDTPVGRGTRLRSITLTCSPLFSGTAGG